MFKLSPEILSIFKWEHEQLVKLLKFHKILITEKNDLSAILYHKTVLLGTWKGMVIPVVFKMKHYGLLLLCLLLYLLYVWGLGYKEDEFSWTNYLKITKAQAAPKHLFASPDSVSGCCFILQINPFCSLLKQ